MDPLHGMLGVHDDTLRSLLGRLLYSLCTASSLPTCVNEKCTRVRKHAAPGASTSMMLIFRSSVNHFKCSNFEDDVHTAVYFEGILFVVNVNRVSPATYQALQPCCSPAVFVYSAG